MKSTSKVGIDSIKNTEDKFTLLFQNHGELCMVFMKPTLKRIYWWTTKLYESTKLNSCKKSYEFTEGFSSRNSVRMIPFVDGGVDKYSLPY
jgi:hypothetical protein